MNNHKPIEDLKNDVSKIYFLLCKLRETNGKIIGVRCHESARIFCNVLKTLGYNVEVANGGYAKSENDGIQHSWVEKIVDYYGTRILIETTPHLFFPDLSFGEIVEKMVILPNDERGKKYNPVDDEAFQQVLNRYQVKIDEKLIERFTSTIIESFEKIR